MDRRRLSYYLLLIGTLFCASCSNSLFKVKPATELPPLPANSRSTEATGITFTVAPLLSDEQIQELFESNLPLAGVLPVRMQLSFQSGAPIELKRARFVVRDSQNRTWKLLTPKQAVSRIMKAKGMTLYNPNAKKQTESDFAAYGLDIKTPLDPGQPTRSGFLFFQTPDKRPIDNSQKLTLSVERLPQSATIPLN